MTAPLLKTICSSRPSSRIVSSTTSCIGSQVATMLRPTDSGCTPRSRSRATNASGGAGASTRFAASAGLIEKRTVLGHDQIAATQLRKGALQVRQLATSDQDQTATGILEPSERRESVGVDHAVMRQRAIVVGGEGQKIHRLVSSARSAWV